MRLDAYEHVASGKVRDIYAVDGEHLLLVASDRISAYDWVLPTEIPDKGAVLTALSTWWFDQLGGIVPHHLVSVDDPRIPGETRGRAMLVRRLAMVDVECVARGYLAGSGLVEYQENGSVCGVPLPAGLQEGSRLPEPIFTPATKAAVGEHDENVAFSYVEDLHGADVAGRLRDTTLAVYALGRDLARERGIIVADTKLEFGLTAAGVLVLADEVLTPDSSRFWPLETWVPGHAQPSFDKQYVRDWLAKESGWDRSSPPPELPESVVDATRERYVEAYERLTGLSFSDWLRAAG